MPQYLYLNVNYSMKRNKGSIACAGYGGMLRLLRWVKSFSVKVYEESF